jgi:hypothetical protein
MRRIMLSSLTKMKRDFSLLQANEKSFLEGAMGTITYLGLPMSTCNSNEKKKKKSMYTIGQNHQKSQNNL